MKIQKEQKRNFEKKINILEDVYITKLKFEFVDINLKNRNNKLNSYLQGIINKIRF
jgi:hypothetical protein